MAEAGFCGQLTTFVLILTSDHCPAERTSDNPIYFPGRGSQMLIQNVLVFHRVHDAMFPNKVSRPLAENHPHNITETSPYFTVGIQFFSWECFALSVYCQKALFLFRPTIAHNSIQIVVAFLQSLGAYIQFFWHSFQIISLHGGGNRLWFWLFIWLFLVIH